MFWRQHTCSGITIPRIKPWFVKKSMRVVCWLLTKWRPLLVRRSSFSERTQSDGWQWVKACFSWSDVESLGKALYTYYLTSFRCEWVPVYTQRRILSVLVQKGRLTGDLYWMKWKYGSIWPARGINVSLWSSLSMVLNRGNALYKCSFFKN